MDICEVQGPKIIVEWVVSQLVVNVEEESVRDILRGTFISYPVQFICKIVRITFYGKLTWNNFDLVAKRLIMLLERRVLNS